MPPEPFKCVVVPSTMHSSYPNLVFLIAWTLEVYTYLAQFHMDLSTVRVNKKYSLWIRTVICL